MRLLITHISVSRDLYPRPLFPVPQTARRPPRLCLENFSEDHDKTPVRQVDHLQAWTPHLPKEDPENNQDTLCGETSGPDSPYRHKAGTEETPKSP